MYNVLVLYNGQSMFTPTVQDYLDSFRRYSANNIHFMHVDHLAKPAFSFDDYDALILTYSCRLCYLENMSPHVQAAVAAFRGLKVAFPQDEYQETNKLKQGIRDLGVKLVFTCVPEDKIAWVYPPKELPGVRFCRVLTGYVPQRLARLPRHKLPPTEKRPNWIGYRGRHLGHCWGDLSYFKSEIGRKFKTACDRRRIPNDIAWSEEARIYQDQWFRFILSCRATLGTPSGCNTFDWDGSMEREYREIMKQQPNMTYAEYRPKIAHKEAEIDMGQVSPRMFESAALGTVMILLEGSYSGVVTPGEDCIVVKQDFSNIDHVLDQLSDDRHVAHIASNAYKNIIQNSRWSYETFMAIVDGEIERMLDSKAPSATIDPQSLRRIRNPEQSLLETVAMKCPDQYPLAKWLDLSHLRDKSSQHQNLAITLEHYVKQQDDAKAFDAAFPTLPPPVATIGQSLTPETAETLVDKAKVVFQAEGVRPFLRALRRRVPLKWPRAH